MSADAENDKIIHSVYYDSENGFGSINDTYQQAKNVLSSITYKDVNEFLERQKSRQSKAYRGFNSCIADNPLKELQLDIADFTEASAVNDGFRYALVAPAIFTKIATAIPMKAKQK